MLVSSTSASSEVSYLRYVIEIVLGMSPDVTYEAFPRATNHRLRPQSLLLCKA